MLSAAAGKREYERGLGTDVPDEPLKLLRSSFSAFSKLDAGSDFASPFRSRDSIVAVVAVVTVVAVVAVVVVVVVVGVRGAEAKNIIQNPRKNLFVRFLDCWVTKFGFSAPASAHGRLPSLR